MNPKAFKTSPFTMQGGGYVNGKYFAPDDFGNYFYGVAARSMGVSQNAAIKGAGVFAIYKAINNPNSNLDWSNFNGFFDEMKDTQMILRGYYGK